MSRITLDIPDETLVALKLSPQAFSEQLRMAAAVKLLELSKLSSGAAAKRAGFPRVVFLNRLADYGVESLRLIEEDFRSETRLA